jgi:type VI protein secretion system component VasK
MKGRPANYEIRYQQARRLVMEGVSPEVATSLSGITLYPFRRRMEREEGVEPEDRRLQRKVDPTPEEIRQRAEEIKAAWTPEEAARRWVGSYSPRLRSRVSYGGAVA